MIIVSHCELQVTQLLGRFKNSSAMLQIEQLEQELAGLQQSLDDKKEQESAMLQV